MTTAFVLSGGGSLGAVQVGMLEALADRGIAPDLILGSSVGALNAAFVAGHGFTKDGLQAPERIWRGLRRQDVFPFNPTRHVLALAGARTSLCSAAGLDRLVEANLPYRQLQDAPIPVHIVVTDVLSGEDVLISANRRAGCCGRRCPTSWRSA